MTEQLNQKNTSEDEKKSKELEQLKENNQLLTETLQQVEMKNQLRKVEEWRFQNLIAIQGIAKQLNSISLQFYDLNNVLVKLVPKKEEKEKEVKNEEEKE